MAYADTEKILATDIAENPWMVDPNQIKAEIEGTTLETLRKALDVIEASPAIEGANFGQLEIFQSWVKKL